MVIRKVKVTGFWGFATVEATLPMDVAIFVGANGTGKTTMINILVAALRADYESLSKWAFDVVEVTLADPLKPSVELQVIVRRQMKRALPAFHYHIGRFQGSLGPDSTGRFLTNATRRRLIESGELEDLFDHTGGEVRSRLKELVSLSWIAVHRDVAVRSDESPGEARRHAVDARVEQLLSRLSRYQLRLEAKSREFAKSFQEYVLQLFLFDPAIDDLPAVMREMSASDVSASERDFRYALIELGIQVGDEQISRHFSQLRTALKAGKLAFEGEVDLRQIATLPLFLRTKRMVEKMRSIKDQRDLLRRPLGQFLDVLHGFIEKKQFSFDPGGNLKVVGRRGGADHELPIAELSSGEKQLLIQLLEVLLQEKQPAILIADEPELSLHISWQEKLLRSLRQINENAQVIVATHSPDIVSSYAKNVIDMEGLTRADS